MVIFNPISETGVRRVCFLGKELFFLQGCMRNKPFVNEMENCIRPSEELSHFGAWKSLVVVEMKSLLRVCLLEDRQSL